MRTSILKKAMAPIGAIVLGIGGAFATASMSSPAALADVPGWKHVSLQQPCVADIMCRTTNTGSLCTSLGAQLFDKANPAINVCDVTLYRIP